MSNPSSENDGRDECRKDNEGANLLDPVSQFSTSIKSKEHRQEICSVKWGSRYQIKAY